MYSLLQDLLVSAELLVAKAQAGRSVTGLDTEKVACNTATNV